MSTVTTVRHYCDWCGGEMHDSGVTTAFSGKVTHWENGPDCWANEELCGECDSKFKALRAQCRTPPQPA